MERKEHAWCHGHDHNSLPPRCYGNTYESWQRTCIPGFNLQRFVEQMITKVLLAHILHGIEVLEELLLTKMNQGVTAAGAEAGGEGGRSH